MSSNVLYYAVYKNGEYYSANTFDEVVRDKSAWFYLIRNCNVSYSYGGHYNYKIVDYNCNPYSFVVGDFEVMQFYTGGTANKYELSIVFKNNISGELNTHKMNAYCHIDHIASVLQFSSKLNECGSYKVYNILTENEELRSEILNLRKEINKLRELISSSK